MIFNTLLCYVKTVPELQLLFCLAVGDFKRFDQWSVSDFYKTENLNDAECNFMKKKFLVDSNWQKFDVFQFDAFHIPYELRLVTIYQSRQG